MVRFENREIETIEEDDSPPYLMGLLGFIPLVGFFVGIFLVLYGIFKYKSKKLTLIGIFCMLFSLIIYSSIFLIIDNLDDTKKAWTQIAQYQLNGLVRNIEFYRLQNGKYPDNLNQLKSVDEFSNYHDSTKGTKSSEKDVFIYKNLNDKYLLFSVGQDGIPNTNDDLYPEMKNFKNIGWVKNP